MTHATPFAGDTMSSRYTFDDEDMYDAEERTTQNVGADERIASAVAGGVLAFAGLALIARGRPVAGAVFGAVGGSLAYRGATGHCGVYQKLGVSADDATRTSRPWTRELVLEESIAVNRSPADLYEFWRNFENLPRVMNYLERVEVFEDGRSQWTAKGVGDQSLTWLARVTADRINEVIGWTTLEESDVHSSGTVEFVPLPGDAGTVVRVSMRYQPPGGAAAALVATILGREPRKMLHEDLRRFRAAIEAGGTPSTEGQPRGKCA